MSDSPYTFEPNQHVCVDVSRAVTLDRQVMLPSAPRWQPGIIRWGWEAHVPEMTIELVTPRMINGQPHFLRCAVPRAAVRPYEPGKLCDEWNVS